jgi:valine dehydrogenase (NAD+)
MTRKAALARLDLGGGKAVVIGDPERRTREQLLAFGEFVESLDGRYITAADMGTAEEEMAVIGERTRSVAGLPRRIGGCGDPSPFTALGVFMAMERACERSGVPLRGARVALQGVGNVGRELVRRLLEAGAAVVVADPDPGAVANLPGDVEVVAPEAITGQACDVFAPCGPAGVIDAGVAQTLRCRIVCGAANNPLAAADVACVLRQRGILYVPDFLASAGGLIHLAVALEGGDDAASIDRLGVITENLDCVLARSEDEALDTASAAERMALALVSNPASCG